MIHELDLPAGSGAFQRQIQSQTADVFKLPVPQKDGTDDTVRVFYPDPATSIQAARKVVDTMRAAGTKQIWDFGPSPSAIVVRGNAATLAKAQQLIESLSQAQ
jgi:hypothetical protein